jgi:hypothetical protein
METPILKALLSYGGLGIATAILLYLVLKFWNTNQDLQKEHAANVKELTQTIIDDSKEQTKVIAENTEVLRQQERTLDTYLKLSTTRSGSRDVEPSEGR